MSWSHECGRRIIFENLFGTNAVSFKGVDTFQQLHTSSVPWGERQHRGEIDRHCLAPFYWREAHCCFEIRMIGHFFRNYIWLHSLHAFSGPMDVPHAGWITARQSRPYRIKESFHIVGCKVNSLRSMHWFAKIHCIDWQLLPCCCRWQLLPKSPMYIVDHGSGAFSLNWKFSSKNYEGFSFRQGVTDNFVTGTMSSSFWLQNIQSKSFANAMNHY